MNICIDGITRPMTEEEERKYYEERENVPATVEDYEQALADLGVRV